MSALTREQVQQALAAFKDPYLKLDYVAAKCVKNIIIEDDSLQLEIELGYPAQGIRAELEQQLLDCLQPLAGTRQVKLDLGWKVLAHKAQRNMKSMEQVRNIIAVASGKGGVGKSTTAVNLALALAAEGARVGILDADIYGPSQTLMLGIEAGRRPQSEDGKFWRSIEAHGIQAMSMGFLLDENTPVVWRGPMVSGALQQLISQTLWQDLDYLIVDMPPGTGDIQLTLSQKVPVSGAVIVTTPQDIALLDAVKGIEMFRKVEVPVLGIVENMSVHVCSQCGHAEHLFGEGGGEKVAADYDTELLGALPLTLEIREQADGGTPSVAVDPDSAIAMIYREVARKLAASLSKRARNYANVFPKIVVEND